MMDSTIFDEKSASELDPQLHFLGHLALALSTTCLLESEMAFVPGLIMFLPLFYAFLWISYVSKGRRILATSVSNVLGILISMLGCFWCFQGSHEMRGFHNLCPCLPRLSLLSAPYWHFWLCSGSSGPRGEGIFGFFKAWVCCKSALLVF